MKAFKFLVLLFVSVVLFSACGKKDTLPANYFSFKGKTYAITDAVVERNVNDSLWGVHLDQYGFLSVSGHDSTTFFIAVSDLPANMLTGNFPSLDISSTADRRIIPVSGTAATILMLPTQEVYISGSGGSMDVTVSGSTYTLKFNAISIGVYSSNGVGGEQYLKAGEITGRYSGIPQNAIITAYNGNSNPLMQAFLKNKKQLSGK